MATRMLQRRGTAAEWAAQNPVLADGEIGFETDTKIIKIGDGVTAWNDLSLSPITAGGTVMTGPLVVLEPTEPDHAARLADIPEVPDTSDFATVEYTDQQDELRLLKSGDTMAGAFNLDGNLLQRALMQQTRERQLSVGTASIEFDGSSAGQETYIRCTGTAARTFTAINLPGTGTGQLASTFVLRFTASAAVTFTGAYWRFTNGVPSWSGQCLMTITLVDGVAIVSFAELSTS